MEVLAAQLLVLVISIWSEFQPNTEKTKEAMCHTNIGMGAGWVLIKPNPFT